MINYTMSILQFSYQIVSLSCIPEHFLQWVEHLITTFYITKKVETNLKSKQKI